MTVDERSRHELFGQLERALGPEAATTLMEYLPPVGWADVATKRDLDASAALTRSELRTEMVDLRSELRTEMVHLRSELRTEMADVRSGIADVRNALEVTEHRVVATLRADMANQTRVLLFGFFGALAGIAGLAVTLGSSG